MELLLYRTLLVEEHRQTRHLTLLINSMAVLVYFFAFLIPLSFHLILGRVCLATGLHLFGG